MLIAVDDTELNLGDKKKKKKKKVVLDDAVRRLPAIVLQISPIITARLQHKQGRTGMRPAEMSGTQKC